MLTHKGLALCSTHLFSVLWCGVQRVTAMEQKWGGRSEVWGFQLLQGVLFPAWPKSSHRTSREFMGMS